MTPLNTIPDNSLLRDKVTATEAPNSNSPKEYDDGEAEDSYTSEDVTLGGFLVVFDFGENQRFAINLHQNNDISGEDDSLDNPGEFYALTPVFFDKAKTRNTFVVDANGQPEVDIFNALSPYVLGVLHHLLNNQYHLPAPFTSRSWMKPATTEGHPLYRITKQGLTLDMAYFFPNEKDCEPYYPHDLCTKVARVAITRLKTPFDISATLTHEASEWAQGGSTKITYNRDRSIHKVELSEPILPQKTLDLLTQRMKSARKELVITPFGTDPLYPVRQEQRHSLRSYKKSEIIGFTFQTGTHNNQSFIEFTPLTMPKPKQ